MNGDAFFEVAQDLLDCVVDRLNVPTGSPSVTGAPTHQHVAVGEVVWDNCCDGTNGDIGGQVWVQVDSVFPSRNPPLPDVAPVACATTSFVMAARVGILRCWPTMNDRGEPPTAATLEAASHGMLFDVAALIEGLVCCARSQDLDLVIGQSSFLGPEGACIGAEVPVTVVLGPCVTC